MKRLLLCALISTPLIAKSPKNFILVIGDGMGMQQIKLLEYYLNASQQRKKNQFHRLDRNGKLFLTSTEAYEAITTDSAAAATHFAIGMMSRPGMVGLKYDGTPQRTLLDDAKERGMSTGFISNTRITHATPAAFLAHQISRKMDPEIASDIIKSGVDVMLSGGFEAFLPKTVNDRTHSTYQHYRKLIPKERAVESARLDERDLIKEAQNNGIAVVFDHSTLGAANALPILGLFSPRSMDDVMTEAGYQNLSPRAPTMDEMASKALSLLARNPKGFFLVVEFGQIDWAAHYNDLGYLLEQMIMTNTILSKLIDWVEKDKNTALLVTADHETGGLGFTYSSRNIAPSFTLNKTEYEPRYSHGQEKMLLDWKKQKRKGLSVLKEFLALDPKAKNAENMKQLVNDSYPTQISMAEAALLVKTIDTSGLKEYREMETYDQFLANYYNGEIYRFLGVLARVTLRDYPIVWGTGTHTSNPVASWIYGFPSAEQYFNGIMHATEVHQSIRKALKL